MGHLQVVIIQGQYIKTTWGKRQTLNREFLFVEPDIRDLEKQAASQRYAEQPLRTLKLKHSELLDRPGKTD